MQRVVIDGEVILHSTIDGESVLSSVIDGTPNHWVGGGVTAMPLGVTENGTYTAPQGKAYTPVSVSVPDPYPWAAGRSF